jgi:hypothetical protein
MEYYAWTGNFDPTRTFRHWSRQDQTFVFLALQSSFAIPPPISHVGSKPQQNATTAIAVSDVIILLKIWDRKIRQETFRLSWCL